MSIDMYLDAAQQQSNSIQQLTTQHVEAYKQISDAIDYFKSDRFALTGAAYDSAKCYCEVFITPLISGCVAYEEALAKACEQYVSNYISNVDSVSLRESRLRDQIEQLTMQIQNTNQFIEYAYSVEFVDYRWVSTLENSKNLLIQSKTKLEQKLANLLAFNETSSSTFVELEALQSAIVVGMFQATRSWNESTMQFDMPPESEMEWTDIIEKHWMYIWASHYISEKNEGKPHDKREIQKMREYLHKSGEPYQYVPKEEGGEVIEITEEELMGYFERVIREITPIDLVSSIGEAFVKHNQDTVWHSMRKGPEIQDPSKIKLPVLNWLKQRISPKQVAFIIGSPDELDKMRHWDKMGRGLDKISTVLLYGKPIYNAWQDVNNGKRTIGQAVAHHGYDLGTSIVSTGLGTAAAAFVVGATPVGWAAFGGAAIGLGVAGGAKVGLEIAYENIPGVKAMVKFVGKGLEDIGKDCHRFFSEYHQTLEEEHMGLPEYDRPGYENIILDRIEGAY